MMKKDHFKQKLLLWSQVPFKELYETNEGKSSYIKFKKFSEKCFNEELKCIGLPLVTKNDDLDLGFRTFFLLLCKNFVFSFSLTFFLLL